MTTIFHVYEIGLYKLCRKTNNASIPSLACNGRGHVTDLTSDYMHGQSETFKMRLPGGLLLSENFIYLRKIACYWQRCEVATFSINLVRTVEWVA